MKTLLFVTAFAASFCYAEEALFSGEFDQFELRSQGLAVWDAELYLGNPGADALVLKTTAEFPHRKLGSHQLQLLGQIGVNETWNLRAGFASDTHPSPMRHWAVISALAAIDAGTNFEITGFTTSTNQSLLLGSEHFWKFAPQWELIPKAEAIFNSQDDQPNGAGQGLSTLELGLRLRYDLAEKFKPYAGINWITSCGNTRKFLNQEGARTQNFSYRAGFTWAF